MYSRVSLNCCSQFIRSTACWKKPCLVVFALWRLLEVRSWNRLCPGWESLLVWVLKMDVRPARMISPCIQVVTVSFSLVLFRLVADPKPLTEAGWTPWAGPERLDAWRAFTWRFFFPPHSWSTSRWFADSSPSRSRAINLLAVFCKCPKFN